jgi:hypothetical protein
MSSLFVFKKPLHSRTTDASGAQKIVYTFPVEATESLCGTNDEEGSLLQALQGLLTEEREWLLRFVEAFLAATKSYFARPYSSAVILRHLTHRVSVVNGTAPPVGPVAFTPTAVVIVQGQFGIEWSARQDSIDIQIPDEDSDVLNVEDRPVPVPVPVPASASASASAVAVSTEPRPTNTVVVPAAPVGSATAGGASAGESLSAVDADALPYTATGDVLSLRTPEQQAQERRRVREAHLRAKLAQYKAERTMTKYIQKYGDDLSYSSSESEWDTEGEGSESESE